MSNLHLDEWKAPQGKSRCTTLGAVMIWGSGECERCTDEAASCTVRQGYRSTSGSACGAGAIEYMYARCVRCRPAAGVCVWAPRCSHSVGGGGGCSGSTGSGVWRRTEGREGGRAWCARGRSWTWGRRVVMPHGCEMHACMRPLKG